MKTKVVGLSGFVVAFAVSACASGDPDGILGPLGLETDSPKFSCIANSRTMRLPADLRATLPAYGFRTPDDAFVAVANSAPGGFAGIFYEDDHFVLTFVDPATAERSRAEIAAILASHRIGGPGFDAQTAEIRGARWTFAELDEWYRYIGPKVFTTESGVSSSDIDERANTIAFGVIDEPSRARLEANLASLNVSCNLVTTVIRPYATIE